MKKIEQLLQEGVAWQFFSLLFRWPDQATMMAAEKLRVELPPHLSLQAQLLGSHFYDPTLQSAYHFLLGSGGKLSPYESQHQEQGQAGIREKGAVLGDVAAFYRAFGFEYHPTLLEAPDHIAVELAFVGYLKIKQVFALSQTDRDSFGICQRAEAAFLHDHLGIWIPDFLERIAQKANHPFYEQSARTCLDFLKRLNLLGGKGIFLQSTLRASE